MTIACGGRCGRPNCRWTGAEGALYSHIGGVKARDSGKGWFAGSRSPLPQSGPMKGPSGSPPGSGPEARPFYAPLKDLPSGFTGAPADKSAPKAPAPVPSGPLFDSTPWWVSLGELLDSTLLKDKTVKIKMTEEKAKRLDASLQAAGWSVTANPNPVALPYWAPVVITVLGAFALPIAIAYVPDLIKRAREQSLRVRAQKESIVAKPAVPGTIRIEVPRSGINPTDAAQGGTGIEPEGEVRMTAAPPPFKWAPMPWHSPGTNP